MRTTSQGEDHPDGNIITTHLSIYLLKISVEISVIVKTQYHLGSIKQTEIPSTCCLTGSDVTMRAKPELVQERWALASRLESLQLMIAETPGRTDQPSMTSQAHAEQVKLEIAARSQLFAPQWILRVQRRPVTSGFAIRCCDSIWTDGLPSLIFAISGCSVESVVYYPAWRSALIGGNIAL
jgi:hypothetical protein